MGTLFKGNLICTNFQCRYDYFARYQKKKRRKEKKRKRKRVHVGVLIDVNVSMMLVLSCSRVCSYYKTGKILRIEHTHLLSFFAMAFFFID